MLWIFGSEVWETPPGQTGGVLPVSGAINFELNIICAFCRPEAQTIADIHRADGRTWARLLA